tara:strand:+ start:749 stop:1021 length:273 start_codon:yes stop_codon:yes gene_type:complete
MHTCFKRNDNSAFFVAPDTSTNPRGECLAPQYRRTNWVYVPQHLGWTIDTWEYNSTGRFAAGVPDRRNACGVRNTKGFNLFVRFVLWLFK